MSEINKNLSNYIIIAIVAVFLTLLSAGGWFYIKGLRENTNKVASEYLSSIVSVKNAEITRWFADIEKLSKQIDYNNPLSEINTYKNKNRRDNALQMWLEETASDLLAESAALYDSEKKLIITVGDSSNKYQPEMVPGNISWNKAVNFNDLSLEKDKFNINAIVPLFDNTGGVLPIGYVQLKINLTKSLLKNLSCSPGSFKSESILVLQEGKIIDFTGKMISNLDSSSAIKKEGVSIFSLLNGTDKTISGIDGKGAEVLVHFIKVQPLNWFVLAKADVNEINGPVKNEKIKVIVFISIVGLVFILVAFILIKPKKNGKPPEKKKSDSIHDTMENESTIPEIEKSIESKETSASILSLNENLAKAILELEKAEEKLVSEENKVEALPEEQPVSETITEVLPEPEKQEEEKPEIFAEEAKTEALPETTPVSETTAEVLPEPEKQEEKPEIFAEEVKAETLPETQPVSETIDEVLPEPEKLEEEKQVFKAEKEKPEVLQEIEAVNEALEDNSTGQNEIIFAGQTESLRDMTEETAESNDEKEILPEIELIEGSLNNDSRKSTPTEYKKPSKEIVAKLEKIKSFGLIPKILFEINLLLNKEPDNSTKLAELIIKEQSITTRLLSVANSPYYSLKRKVTSVEYALMLLGREEVCRLVTALSLSDVVRFPSTPKLKYLDYWFHSMMVGFTARDIAKKLGFHNIINDAFLGGIFHDLGIQILAKHFPGEFDQIISRLREGKEATIAETEVLDCTHQEIGRYAVEKWGLPEDIYDSLSCHHNPNQSEGNKALAGIINMSDWMTHQITQGESFWEQGLELENNNYKILGFRSVELRNRFLEEYYPFLHATMESIQF